MTNLFSHKNRPVHLGPYPLERLKRINSAPASIGVEPKGLELNAPEPHSLINGMHDYFNIMDRLRIGEKALKQAPIPNDSTERSNHLKAACYYLDASMAGVCRIPDHAILDSPIVNKSLAESMEQQYAAGSADNPMAEIMAAVPSVAYSRQPASVRSRIKDTASALC